MAPLETASKFLFITTLLDLCAPLPIAFLIAISYTSYRRIFNGISQDVGRADFSKNLYASPFKQSLSIETMFSLRLVEQYLKRITLRI